MRNNPAALAGLIHWLACWCWQVHAARDVGQALAAPRQPDLQILDFHLGGGHTGPDVWRRLCVRHAEVPTVMLIADLDGDLQQRLLELGVGVPYKPVRPLALRQVLQRVAAAG